MNHLVAGMGEIGSAVAQALATKDYDVSTIDMHSEPIKRQMDVLHICFGYNKNFVRAAKAYQKKYNPKLIIIYSTVPIGTTKKIDHAIHSPIEGRHPRLYSSVMLGKRYIGYNNAKDGQLAATVWEFTDHELVPSSDHTEFLKLASTAKYGINLVFADYVMETSKKLGMEYELAKEWDVAYNQLYKKLKFPNFRKFVLESPSGHIGGHCVVPNAFLLDEQFPHEMLKMIKEYI